MQSYTVHFLSLMKQDTFVEDREVPESVLGTEFLNCLEKKREGLYLDLNLNSFERQYQEVNELFIEKKLFLRVYALKESSDKQSPKRFVDSYLGAF